MIVAGKGRRGAAAEECGGSAFNEADAEAEVEAGVAVVAAAEAGGKGLPCVPSADGTAAAETERRNAENTHATGSQQNNGDGDSDGVGDVDAADGKSDNDDGSDVGEDSDGEEDGDGDGDGDGGFIGCDAAGRDGVHYGLNYDASARDEASAGFREFYASLTSMGFEVRCGAMQCNAMQ
jgi:hypothetical protein